MANIKKTWHRDTCCDRIFHQPCISCLVPASSGGEGGGEGEWGRKAAGGEGAVAETSPNDDVHGHARGELAQNTCDCGGWARLEGEFLCAPVLADRELSLIHI